MVVIICLCRTGQIVPSLLLLLSLVIIQDILEFYTYTPSINSIIFNGNNSIINKINFPKPEDGSTRKVNIIFKDSKNTNINELRISDNLNINLQGKINLKKLNLSNTSSLKTLPNSKINIMNSSGPVISISSDGYIKHIRQLLTNTVIAQFDYGVGEKGECLYYYPDKVTCNNIITDADGNSTTCNNLLSVKPTESLTTQPTAEDIISNLYSITCSKCDQATTINEPVLQSYLYPYLDLFDKSIQLHCVNHTVGLGYTSCFYINTSKSITSDNDATRYICKCYICGITCIYDKAYVEAQLQII